MYYFAWVVGGGQIGAESGRSSRCKQQGGGCVVLCRSVSVQLYGRILLRTTGKGPHIRIDEYEYSRTGTTAVLSGSSCGQVGGWASLHYY